MGQHPTSWAVEINMHGADMEEWIGNTFRFQDHDNAEAYAINLTHRWADVRRTRIVPSPDPPNAQYINGYIQATTTRPTKGPHDD